MCLVLYMASEKSRPTIPWNESAPAFHVKDDDPASRQAARHFSKPRLYYLGSDNGCGCGFPQYMDWMREDETKLASTNVNKRALVAYLEVCLADEETVELFSCWSGDEGENLESTRDILVQDITAKEFFFSERQLTKVRKKSPA